MLNLLSDKVSGEQLGTAAIQALIGFLIVIIGIVVIIFLVWLAGVIVNKISNKQVKEKKPAKSQPEISANEKIAPLTEKAESAQEDIPDEVKAAIVAAIMAYYSAEKPHAEFKVKRIKRI